MARFNKAKKFVNTDGNVQFDFANGQTLTLDPSKCDEAIRNQAMLHGFSQKIGDSYASAEDADEAYAAAVAVVDGLTSGKWTTRTASEGGTGTSTMLVEALHRVTAGEGRSIADCAALIETMDDAQVEGLKKLPPIAAALDGIRAERALAKAQKSAKSAEGATLDLSSIIPA